MVRRRVKRKRQLATRCDDADVPDPTGGLATAALISSAAAIGTTALSGGFSKPSTPKPVQPDLSPLAGESTTLTPGQKINGIVTTPTGILGQPSYGNSFLSGK